mmetsp:Transcript_6603/g.25497  ORF Transcript_6603/g.25497 Transcript_6603/m.25497 type:complete len:364 (+) Transcript_6603:1988-3079(+)
MRRVHQHRYVAIPAENACPNHRSSSFRDRLRFPRLHQAEELPRIEKGLVIQRTFGVGVHDLHRRKVHPCFGAFADALSSLHRGDRRGVSIHPAVYAVALLDWHQRANEIRVRHPNEAMRRTLGGVLRAGSQEPGLGVSARESNGGRRTGVRHLIHGLWAHSDAVKGEARLDPNHRLHDRLVARLILLEKLAELGIGYRRRGIDAVDDGGEPSVKLLLPGHDILERPWLNLRMVDRVSIKGSADMIRLQAKRVQHEDRPKAGIEHWVPSEAGLVGRAPRFRDPRTVAVVEPLTLATNVVDQQNASGRGEDRVLLGPNDELPAMLSGVAAPIAHPGAGSADELVHELHLPLEEVGRNRSAAGLPL